jgi:transmembrane sensor
VASVAAIALAAGVVLVGVPSAERDEARSYHTGNGERATVRMADGSTLQLAPATTVSIANDGATGARVVTLVGEAHFSVVSKAHAPFIVRSGGLTTRVLGTEFDVRRYADDRVGQVAVFAGRVATTTARGEATVLDAGMVGRFSDSATVGVTSGAPREYADWTTGRLVFDDVSVPAMLTVLHRWSGYQFKLADSTLANRHVTTAFVIGENRAMLQQLKGLLGVRMTFDDSVVTLHSDRAAADSIRDKARPRRAPDPHVTELGR